MVDEDNKNVYTAMFTPHTEGEYRAVLHNNLGEPETETARFTVYQDLLELRYISADREMLDQLAAITGGQMLELDELNDLPEKIKAFERLSCERIRPEDIWDTPLVFGILVAMLGCEWLLRRTSGLV